mgnify:CR=1 FL=1
METNRQIVFIMTDSQRADMLNCYYQSGLKTPCLDQLAEQSIRFDKAYTCSPVCAPARSAIFTGVWPHANGVWSNELPLGNTMKTLGQRLSAQDVHCAYIGKWHLDGHDYFGDGVCPDGWDDDYWYDMRRYLEELSPEERAKSRMTQGEQGSEREFTFAHRCSNKAIKFLSEHGDEDFFLAVSYDEPHHPFLCPEPYASEYADFEFPKSKNIWDQLDGKPEHQKVWGQGKLPNDKDAVKLIYTSFFGCNGFVDDEIGRVVSRVKELAPNAVIIFTSDHGDMLQSHCMGAKGPSPYEEIMRIPFIINWPGITDRGVVFDKPVSHINIVPTIFDIMGLEKPREIDGDSIYDVILNPENAADRKIFFEYGRFGCVNDAAGGFQPLRGVFDGRYKLCINLLTSDELYDLETDPEEMNNLIEAEETEAIRNSLHDDILLWMNQTRDPFRGYYWHCRPWRKDAPEPSWSYTGKRRYEASDVGEPTQLDYQNGVTVPQDRGHYPEID